MSIFMHEGRRRPNGKHKGIECPPYLCLPFLRASV